MSDIELPEIPEAVLALIDKHQYSEEDTRCIVQVLETVNGVLS